MNADPATVYKDLGGIGDGARCNFFQVLHAPLLQELQDGRGRVSHRDVSHECQVLDEADCGTFRRLSRTDHAPEGVVQLTRFRQLSVATDRRVDATKMRESGRVGQSVQHLGDSSSSLVSFLLISPVASSQRVPQAVRNDPARTQDLTYEQSVLQNYRPYLVLMANSRLKSFPLSMNFCAYILISFMRFLNRPLKRNARRGPAKSSLLLP